MKSGSTVSAIMISLVLVAASSLSANTHDEIDALLSKYHDVGKLNGSILVAQGDQILYQNGFGQADMAWDIPNTPETKFRIGSVTKQFTAAIILQLAEEGKVDPDEKVVQYLPEYPTPQGEKVTIHHLLNHTSGIPSFTGLPNFGEEIMRNPYEPDSLVNTFAGLELEFEPGTDWNYSNSGYFLLGALIEKVIGKSYETVLQERLLEPLGLGNTGYGHYSTIIEEHAEGYARTPVGFENAPYLDTSVPYSAGMMYSTVGDLHKWTRALHSAEPFESQKTLEKMITPARNDYGYGIGAIHDSLSDGRVKTWIHHGGGINGFASALRYQPGDAYTIVVLDNTAGNTGQVAESLANLLYGQQVDLPKQSIRYVLGETIEAKGLEAGISRYRELKKTRPDRYDFGESELNLLGYFYLQNGDVARAIKIFQLNIEAYPEAYNVYDSLGEAYLAAGEYEKAKSNYQKAVELKPDFQNARRMLKRVERLIDNNTRE